MIVGEAVGKGACDLCGNEVVPSVRVEQLLDVAVRGGAPNAVVWRPYSPGESCGFFSYNVLVARAMCRPCTCPCMSVLGVPSNVLMLREQYREKVGELIGEFMSVEFLLSLPTHMVAWENAPLVGVIVREGRCVLDADGHTLLSYIKDLGRGGRAVVKPQFHEDDILRGFSYLRMVKRAHRGDVAMRFGPSATLKELMSSVAVDWFDWEDFYNLSFESSGDGTGVVSRQPGAMLVTELLQVMADGFPVHAESVVEGSHVTSLSTVVQFMPGPDSEEAHEVFEMFRPSSFRLANGLTFLPMGDIAIFGDDKIVSFEPGVQLRTNGGAIIRGRNGISVVLNGSVQFTVEPDGQVARDDRRIADNDFELLYSAAVVVESIKGHEPLGRWYRRVFDRTSTVARFFVGAADFILLSTPVFVNQPVVKPPCDMHDTPERMKGVHSGLMSWGKVKRGSRVRLPATVAVYSAGNDMCRVSPVLNGCVHLTGSDRVGVMQSGYLSVPSEDWDDDAQWLMTATLSDAVGLSCNVDVIHDDYAVDRGGPSDSDGEWFDETATSVDVRNDFRLLKWYSSYGSDLQGFCSFVRFMRDPWTTLHTMRSLQVDALLRVPASAFTSTFLDDTDVMVTSCGVSVVDKGQGTCSWRDVLMAVRHWETFLSYGFEDLRAQLCSRFPDVDVERVISQHKTLL